LTNYAEANKYEYIVDIVEKRCNLMNDITPDKRIAQE